MEDDAESTQDSGTFEAVGVGALRLLEIIRLRREAVTETGIESPTPIAGSGEVEGGIPVTGSIQALKGECPNFSVPIFVVLLTQPHHIKRLRIIIVVRLDAISCSAAFTRHSLDMSRIQSVLDTLLRATLFRITAVPFGAVRLPNALAHVLATYCRSHHERAPSIKRVDGTVSDAPPT